MIVWVNGPFGVGKSSTVGELLTRYPDASTFDPERWGWILQRTVGWMRPGDFQDLRAWRTGTIRAVLRRSRGSTLLIVPMSLLDPTYTEEIISCLREHGRMVVHVTLHASADVLRARIEGDVRDPGARPWRLTQLARYEAEAASLAERGPVIDTDELTPAEVADTIGGLIAAHQGPRSVHVPHATQCTFHTPSSA
jgi:hypothetical protein